MGQGEALLISRGGRILHQRIPIDVFQGPRGQELGEAFVQERAVCLVVPYHAEEPVVPHLVCEKTTVTRVAAAIQGQHGVFHAITCIGHDHLRVGVHPEVAAVTGDDLRGVFGGVLPTARVRFLHQRHAFHAVPFRFADAVVRVGGEGEVVDVLGMELPHLAFSGLRSGDHRRCFVPRFVLEVADVKLRFEIGRQHVLLVLQPAGGVQYIVVREVQVHVECAEVTIEFTAEVLLRVPPEPRVVHRDAWIPVYTIVVLGAPAVEELHAPVHIAGPVRGEADAEGGACARWQRLG